MPDPIDLTVRDVDQISPKRICPICGSTLSRHNTRGYCFHHPDQRKEERKTVKQLQESRAAAVLRARNARAEMQAILQEGGQRKRPVVFQEAEVIVGLLCDDCGMTRDELFEKTRRHPVVHIRQILMFILYTDKGFSYPSIGNLFGGLDHTTIMHGVRKITEEQTFNLVTKETIARIRYLTQMTEKT